MQPLTFLDLFGSKDPIEDLRRNLCEDFEAEMVRSVLNMQVYKATALFEKSPMWHEVMPPLGSVSHLLDTEQGIFPALDAHFEKTKKGFIETMAAKVVRHYFEDLNDTNTGTNLLEGNSYGINKCRPIIQNLHSFSVAVSTDAYKRNIPSWIAKGG